MFYLLWCILNIGLGLFFLYLCFRSVKLIGQKFGLLAGFVFLLGLLSFVNHQPKELGVSPDKDKWSWEAVSKDDSLFYLPQKTQKIILESNLMFNIELSVFYLNQDGENEMIPVRAYCRISGSTSGYKWIPISVSINKTGEHFEYFVSGEIELSLLGATLHHNYKNYSGILKTG